MPTRRTRRRRTYARPRARPLSGVSRAVPVVLACGALAAYARWIRPGLLTWGATREEITRVYPGDELVPDADATSTMATTLPAPPETVWAWLVQMGYDRGGWYSWDWLDHYGRPGTDHIDPRWQTLEEGQSIDTARGGRSWFSVALIAPHRTLVLRSDLDLTRGHSFDPRTGPAPRARLDGIWGFHLAPAPGGATRLVVRTRGLGRPRPLTRPLDLLIGEPVHFVMQARQFQNLRTRVAAAA
ncbi:hypothetical protein ABZT08_06405 [Streptomyces sp. NPDC005526]|uniref:hypothetical protein n=1 Tax=Streptomyces sp. NPDC005526 TaxID=3156885 RepID=UPI0033A29069